VVYVCVFVVEWLFFLGQINSKKYTDWHLYFRDKLGDILCCKIVAKWVFLVENKDCIMPLVCVSVFISFSKSVRVSPSAFLALSV